MFKNIILLLLLLGGFLCAQISGIVYQDLPMRNLNGELKLNRYGVQENNELGVKGIRVTAYPENISTLTDSNGSWSLNTSKDSRVEFTSIPSYLKESPNANVNNASVRFIKDSTSNITFGLHNPSDYANNTNPIYIANVQQNGTHQGSDLQGIQFIQYNATGMNSNYNTVSIPAIGLQGQQGTGLAPLSTISIDRVGSTWGKAYQKNKKRVFLSSMLQRHVGLHENTSTIYIIDYSNNKTDDSKVEQFSIQGIIPQNNNIPIDLGSIDRITDNNYQLHDNPIYPNIDFDAYAKTGKISYGGIDIDESRDKLWLVNLHQKGLISIDISEDTVSNQSVINQYLLKDIPNLPVCHQGELRPWGIKIHENAGYLGAVCDASISKSPNDLSAFVLKFDLIHPENGLETILSFDLNYTKELRGWHAWEDDYITDYKTLFHYYAVPILSDIEFDQYNNIYLAFSDRHAMQSAVFNYPAIKNTIETNEVAYVAGEILKFCNNSNGYTKESTNGCEQYNYSNYTYDFTNQVHEYFNDNGLSGEVESSNGALALLPGSEQIMVTAVDPHPEVVTGDKRVYWNSQGVNTFDLNNGSIINWYATAMTKGNGLSRKANGMGDIELITENAPIEIGDRVWNDENANGIQDANESGISGVKINLICSGTTYSTTTDHNGTYIFSNDSTLTDSIGHKYNVNKLIEKNPHHCYIEVPNIKGNQQQNTLEGYNLTPNKLGEGNYSFLNDSDANLTNNSAYIPIASYQLLSSGSNNHSLDIGFTTRTTSKNSTVRGASVISQQSCNCSSYKSNSVPIFNNKLIVLLLIILFPFFGLLLLKKELYSSFH